MDRHRSKQVLRIDRAIPLSNLRNQRDQERERRNRHTASEARSVIDLASSRIISTDTSVHPPPQTATMLFEDLATELVIQVFLSCSSINDVLALSTTCRRFRNISLSSQRLAILEHAAEAQYGPLLDLTQLLTHNSSQPAHFTRDVPFSFALVKQIVHAGRIAEKWCNIYPFKKWKHNYESRRLITDDERYRLRRAIYRTWLYSRAFHNALHPRESRVTRPVIQKRAALLHNWTTPEIAEIADVNNVVREVVQNNICPSNGTIARKFKKRHPNNDQSLLFNIHLNYPPPAPSSAAHNPFTNQTPATNLWGHFNTTPSTSTWTSHSYPGPSSGAGGTWMSRYNNTPTYTSRYNSAASKFALHPSHEIGAEGWGDDISHYYHVEDYMKLDPEQILWLKENAPLKGMVEGYVRLLGSWFENNGATLGQTIDWVLDERGESVAEFMDDVEEGRAGVAILESAPRERKKGEEGVVLCLYDD